MLPRITVPGIKQISCNIWKNSMFCFVSQKSVCNS